MGGDDQDRGWSSLLNPVRYCTYQPTGICAYSTQMHCHQRVPCLYLAGAVQYPGTLGTCSLVSASLSSWDGLDGPEGERGG